MVKKINYNEPELKNIFRNIQQFLKSAKTTSNNIKVHLVVADFMHGCYLLLQPVVELKAELPSVHLKACSQRTQLCHEDLQTGTELQLLCYHVDLRLALKYTRVT